MHVGPFLLDKSDSCNCAKFPSDLRAKGGKCAEYATGSMQDYNCDERSRKQIRYYSKIPQSSSLCVI